MLPPVVLLFPLAGACLGGGIYLALWLIIKNLSSRPANVWDYLNGVWAFAFWMLLIPVLPKPLSIQALIIQIPFIVLLSVTPVLMAGAWRNWRPLCLMPVSWGALFLIAELNSIAFAAIVWFALYAATLAVAGRRKCQRSTAGTRPECGEPISPPASPPSAQRSAP